MLFNSIEFAIFLPLVFLLYWFVFQRNLRAQNLLIVVVSYLFYGWWDWRFLFLIAFTTGASFASGVLIAKCKQRRDAKIVAAINIVLNLVILCTFKYFNFFSENFARLFQVFGYELDWVTLDILLPVGISFYTFQALSYTIDVYKGKIAPTRDVVSFFAYVSFFPQLVAGPIERATNLLPQFYKSRTFDYLKAADGCRQILWGLFKKIVVADNCAIIANQIFNNSADMSGSTLVVGAIMFSFQIYGDFSGYSDIAIGTARLFGIDLMRNFNFPYFSRNIGEFWRRWHISLNTWFRDYIYFPLGGSRGGKVVAIRNTAIIFLVSGFWHGANWTFITWGAYHALLFIPLLIMNRNKKHTDSVAQHHWYPSFREVVNMGVVFVLVMVGWIIFRAETVTHAWSYIGGIFSASLFTAPTLIGLNASIAILILVVVEWLGRKNQHALQYINVRYIGLRYMIYCAIVGLIIYLGDFGNNQFIYFQF